MNRRDNGFNIMRNLKIRRLRYETIHCDGRDNFDYEGKLYCGKVFKYKMEIPCNYFNKEDLRCYYEKIRLEED